MSTANELRTIRHLIALIAALLLGSFLYLVISAIREKPDPYIYSIGSNGETYRLDPRIGAVDIAGKSGWEPWSYIKK